MMNNTRINDDATLNEGSLLFFLPTTGDMLCRGVLSVFVLLGPVYSFAVNLLSKFT